MPYLMSPANYTQTMRPNLYNVAYRRVGAYKGMGRLHPSNYLEIGTRPNRIGATTGQYSTLSTQLSLLPPSLRGMGMLTPRWRGLGQVSTISASTPGLISGVLNYTDILATSPGGGSYIDPSQIATGSPVTVPTGISTNTVLMIAGGVVLLMLLTSRR